MFSKTIFKQTLKQNWKLWAIFTALSAVMVAVIIAVFDPRMIQSMMDMFADMPGLGDMIGERMSGELSLLGMLGNSFYSMQGLILPLVFVIMTANSLIASQVDRGSMAYILSTPIKRVKVVSTQALYMVTSVLCMFLVVTLVGLSSVQLFHNGLWGEAFTPDVIAAAEVLALSKEEVSGDLSLILNDEEALRAGAKARGLEEDVYTAYLNLKLMEETGEVPPMGANMMNADNPLMAAMQGKVIDGLSAAAEELGMDVADLSTNMGKLKDHPTAIAAAAEASGLPETIFTTIINQQLAAKELNYDHGIDFNIIGFVNMNLGVFLLMFATAGISFLFSCIFNLTKNSLALGAGIPIASLILQIMSQASKELENLKFLSLNTLFDPAAIAKGGTFWPQFAAMAALGAALYLIGIKVFKEKDLPL